MAPKPHTAELDALLSALEERVRRAAHAIQRLKAENARLTRELASAATRATDWQQRCTAWDRDRTALETRLERLLNEIDHLAHEGAEPS
jgi:chromosome segregation ATPase